MNYRVYDKEEKKWMHDDIYLTPDGELMMSKKMPFGLTKLYILPQSRYVYHDFIGLYDKNNAPVYVGDYVEAQIEEDKIIVGLVTFANETSGFIILGLEENKFYYLGTGVCGFINVIGNVFDTSIEVDGDGQ